MQIVANKFSKVSKATKNSNRQRRTKKQEGLTKSYIVVVRISEQVLFPIETDIFISELGLLLLALSLVSSAPKTY